LEDVNWNGADLTSVLLKQANLRNAKLNETRFFDANFEKANLKDANLRRAYLRGANLQEADLGDANLQNANLLNTNLKGAKISKYQICKAGLLYKAQIDEDLLNEIVSDKGCAYKLTEESYDEWVKKWQEKQRQEILKLFRKQLFHLSLYNKNNT